jgi:DNA repair exonuclease SbcCD ATPase subunit
MVLKHLLIVAIGLSSACSFHYTMRVGPMQRNLDQAAGQTHKLMRNVDQARKERQRMISDLMAQGAKASMAPYPELRTLLRSSADIRRKLQRKSVELQKLRKRFAKLSRGHKKLRSDRPKWKAAQRIRDRLKPLHSEIQSLANKAQATLKQFDALARKNKLGRMKVGQLAAKASKQLKALDKSLRAARQQVNKAKSKLRDVGPRLSTEGRQVRHQALQDMTKQHRIVENLMRKMTKSLRRFEKLRAGRKEMMVGPGLLAHQLLPSLKKTSAEINKALKAMNAAGKRFQSAPK